MKIPFSGIFTQRAMGLSIIGNDLIITTLCKILVKYSHETIKVKDFMIKDAQQLHPSLPQKKSIDEIILSVPRELAIIREIDCPYSNLKELKEALTYQLDSFIPFSNEDVYFDIQTISYNTHETKVIIVAVKKTELDNVLSRLQVLEIIPSRVIISPFAFLPIVEEKEGIVALISKNLKNYSYNLFEKNNLVLSSIIKTEDELNSKIKTNPPAEILLSNLDNNILPHECSIPSQLLDETSESYGAGLYGLSNYSCNLSLVRHHKKRLNPQITTMCFFISFLIFFSFLIPYIQNINNLAILKKLNTQIKTNKKDVSNVEKIQERITILEEMISNINEVRREYMPRIDIILEFAKTLPGDAWIKSTYIASNTFEIEGDAISSTNLVPVLENSQLFSGVGLTSPVTKTQSGKDKFRIKGNVGKQ